MNFQNSAIYTGSWDEYNNKKMPTKKNFLTKETLYFVFFSVFYSFKSTLRISEYPLRNQKCGKHH